MVNHPNRSRRTFWLYDRDEDKLTGPATAREADRDWSGTDAGVTTEPFVVRADGADNALSLAREWVELWKIDDNGDVGDMMLVERRYGPRGTYMILQRAP